MKLPLKIATRYLFSRKINLVNIITLISVIGVAGMTTALIIILSVFNGFDSIISNLINMFDPDTKITSTMGKTLELDSTKINQLQNINGIKSISCTIEETALFQYDGRQHIATIKGVDNNYTSICDIENTIYDGNYMLQDTFEVNYAIVGVDIAANLWVQVNAIKPIAVYVPVRSEKVSINAMESFKKGYLTPAGIFHIHQDFDSKYVIAPINFVRELLKYNDNEYSSLEVAVKPNFDVDVVAAQIKTVLGDNFTVKNRYQQQDMLYKIMKSEKLSIFVMLTFILIIASFNIVGALTMLMIDKKNDVNTLICLGAEKNFIRKIFLNTGYLITFLGIVIGIVLGLLLCYIQIKFKILGFPEGSYIIDSYPVEIRFLDIVYTTIVVSVIGLIASLIPVRKVQL